MRFAGSGIVIVLMLSPELQTQDSMEQNSRNTNYQFWRQDNHPIVLITAPFINQKLEYIHNNPVVAGIVDKAEEYVYSSARDYFNGKQCGLLEVELL